MPEQIRWVVVKGDSSAVKHIVDKTPEKKARQKDSEPSSTHVPIPLHPLQHPIKKHI